MRKIILASGSPRRQELVSHMGIGFTALPSNFEEWLDDKQPVEEVAKELALGKALDVAQRFPDALVIGSDTILTLHGRQLGKLPDAETARQLLQEMSGQKVEIYCAIALVCKETGLKKVAVERAAIVFAPYDDAATDKYLASNEWQDKAGGVSIQSATTPPVAHIEGDYDAIVGISTRILAAMLKEQGIEAFAYRPDHSYLQKQLA